MPPTANIRPRAREARLTRGRKIKGAPRVSSGRLFLFSMPRRSSMFSVLDIAAFPFQLPAALFRIHVVARQDLHDGLDGGLAGDGRRRDEAVRVEAQGGHGFWLRWVAEVERWIRRPAGLRAHWPGVTAR